MLRLVWRDWKGKKMINLNEAAEVLEELDELGLEIAGETSGIHVAGGVNCVAVESRHRVWDDQDGSDWTQQNEYEVVDKKGLREAVLGELEARALFTLRLVNTAREKGGS